MENPINMDDLGVLQLQETSICRVLKSSQERRNCAGWHDPGGRLEAWSWQANCATICLKHPQTARFVVLAPIGILPLGHRLSQWNLEKMSWRWDLEASESALMALKALGLSQTPTKSMNLRSANTRPGARTSRDFLTGIWHARDRWDIPKTSWQARNVLKQIIDSGRGHEGVWTFFCKGSPTFNWMIDMSKYMSW